MSSVVGQNIPHDSAKGHVTGASLYVDDTPPYGSELFVDFYYSPLAHANIVEIDLEPAFKIPGVVGLYTYKDIEGSNKFGPITEDETLLAEDTVQFIGHPIVIIAAESKGAIRQAKRAIIVKLKELEPILSIDQARQKGSYIGQTKTIKRGDLSKGFAEAEFTISGTFISEGQDHFYLESQAAIAYPGEFDTVVIHSSTQNPSEVQEVAAHVLGLRQNQVVCITKRMGGGFGGKECQATHPAVMAALVALKSGRPARIVYNKDDDMQTTGGRHPFQTDYKVGFTKEGLITALKVDLFSNGGAADDLSTAVMGRAMTHAENAYYIPHIEISGTVCRTNLPPNTAFRGFGGPQGVANIENIMEEIACFLKRDAAEIRRLNCYGIDKCNVTPYGQTLPNNTLPMMFDRIIEESSYKKRWQAVREFNAVSRTHLKGIAITPVKFGISFTTKFLNQANALVLVFKDGTVQVSTGATEMGQGVNTKIRQLVADELSIDVENVLMMVTSTEKNNNTSATAASSSSDLNGSAAVSASRKIKERLAEVASRHFAGLDLGIEKDAFQIVFKNGFVYDLRLPDKRISFQELVRLAYRNRVDLGERGFYSTQGIEFDWEKGQGTPFLYFTMGWAVSEVKIDRFTGELKVERVDVLMDIGKPINPGIDRGQITGGFIQGMGWVTTEKLVYTERGELLSHSPTTYKIPNIQDVPAAFNVNYIDNPHNTANIRGSKAVGEPPLLLAISVWAAIKHALSFAANGEIPKLVIPATNEEILMRIVQYERQARDNAPAWLLKS